MNLSITDQRQGVRACSAYAVRVNHQDGRALGKGRTANISESGVLVLIDAVEDMEVGQRVLVDMILPGSLGVGLELLSKIRNGH